MLVADEDEYFDIKANSKSATDYLTFRASKMKAYVSEVRKQGTVMGSPEQPINQNSASFGGWM